MRKTVVLVLAVPSFWSASLAPGSQQSGAEELEPQNVGRGRDRPIQPAIPPIKGDGEGWRGAEGVTFFNFDEKGNGDGRGPASSMT